MAGKAVALAGVLGERNEGWRVVGRVRQDQQWGNAAIRDPPNQFHREGRVDERDQNQRRNKTLQSEPAEQVRREITYWARPVEVSP